MLQLAGKVAIVTASTKGIGLSIAKRLCLNGAKVVISSRHEKNVNEVVKELGKHHDVAGIACHVGKSAQRRDLIEKAVETFGGVDILVSNAGVNPAFGPMIDTSEDQWNKIFDINVKSAFLLTKEVVPHMKSRGGGNIIYISSVAGYKPFPFLGAYSVSKTALLGLTKAFSAELAPLNIRVNGVAPGVIKTQFSKELYSNPDISELWIDQVSMRRAGLIEEISGIVSFLASDDASYITGETIAATGGMPTRL